MRFVWPPSHLFDEVPAEVEAREPHARALLQHPGQKDGAGWPDPVALHRVHVFEAAQVDGEQAELAVPAGAFEL